MRSSPRIRVIRIALFLVAGATVLASVPTASAGIFGRRARDRDEPAETDAPPEPTGPPPLAATGPLWPMVLPRELGPLPQGLANASAQGCAACHATAHAGWSTSGHATPPSAFHRQTAARVGDPGCLSCHQPLVAQHTTTWTQDLTTDTTVTASNPAWSATLAQEGATCAACHIADGHVVGAHADAHGPHPGRWTDTLDDAQACATCHQATLEEGGVALYDTVGEWERSPWSAAGVGCVDCHGRGAVDGAAFDHAMGVPAARAVSLLLDAPAEGWTRGGDPRTLAVTLQNTGAGHAFPTGSPWTGIRLDVGLFAPADDGEIPVGEPLQADLARTFSEAPPWTVQADTRLQAGGQRSWTHEVAVPVDAPRGPYTLRATLTRTRAGSPQGDPVLVQEVPIRIR